MSEDFKNLVLKVQAMCSVPVPWRGPSRREGTEAAVSEAAPASLPGWAAAAQTPPPGTRTLAGGEQRELHGELTYRQNT